MFTRKDYLDGTVTHEMYYSQFVGGDEFGIVKSHFTEGEICNAYTQDEHFNTIPLSVWDALSYSIRKDTADRLRSAGDYLTPAGSVCILKMACKIWADALMA